MDNDIYGLDALFDYRLNTTNKQKLPVNTKVTYRKTLYTSGTISLWSLATWTHLSSSGRSKSILYSGGTVKLSGQQLTWQNEANMLKTEIRHTATERAIFVSCDTSAVTGED